MSVFDTPHGKIQVRDLNFYYGKFHALKNISLDIAQNQVTAFIGPSGCGKSTLFRTFNKMFALFHRAYRRTDHRVKTGLYCGHCYPQHAAGGALFR